MYSPLLTYSVQNMVIYFVHIPPLCDVFCKQMSCWPILCWDCPFSIFHDHWWPILYPGNPLVIFFFIQDLLVTDFIHIGAFCDLFFTYTSSWWPILLVDDLLLIYSVLKWPFVDVVWILVIFGDLFSMQVPLETYSLNMGYFGNLICMCTSPYDLFCVWMLLCLLIMDTGAHFVMYSIHRCLYGYLFFTSQTPQWSILYKSVPISDLLYTSLILL